MKKILTLLLILISLTTYSQSSYDYSYIEPCSGKLKSLTVPIGAPGSNVTVDYYGHVGTFNSVDFNNGNFQTWMNTVSGTNTSQPCGAIATVLTNNINMTVAQNVISTVVSVANITSMMSDILSDVAGGGMSSNLANALDNSENGDSSNSNDKKEEKSPGSTNGGSTTSGSTNGSTNGNSTTNGSTNGSTTSGSTNGSTTSGSTSGSTNGNSTTSGSTNGSTNGGSTTSGSTSVANNTTTPSVSTSGTGVTTQGSGGGSGSTANAVSNSEDNSSGDNKKDEDKNTSTSSSSSTTSTTVADAEDNSSGGSSGGKGNKSEKKTGSMIGSGDIVVMKSAEDPTAKNQFKFTSSMTMANTDNTRVKGVLVNFTSVVNNTNITLYKAWVFKKSKLTFIAANSSMMNFDKDFFNTTTMVLSKRYKGNWKKLTTMAGLNYTAGKYGEKSFMNISAIGGGFYSYNISPKISGSVLFIGVYSPFTQFYDGKWWDSSILIVPYSTWDYKLTKTFKFNVSFSGVYEMNKSMLNYQVLTGGKIMF